MGKIFVTSDTHFGHANIIKYCDRPFANANDMDKALIDRWNARVSDQDTVYHLGDFAFANELRILEIINRLCFAHLILVPGNHDDRWMKLWHRDAEAFPIRVEVVENVHELLYDGQTFVMCHFPMEQWNMNNHGSIHLHGHSHNSKSVQKTIRLPRRYDVGVDMYGGPVQLTGDCRYLDDPKGWQ